MMLQPPQYHLPAAICPDPPEVTGHAGKAASVLPCPRVLPRTLQSPVPARLPALWGGSRWPHKPSKENQAWQGLRGNPEQGNLRGLQGGRRCSISNCLGTLQVPFSLPHCGSPVETVDLPPKPSPA